MASEGIRIRPVRADKPRFTALLYGDPGSGKTTLAASAQDSEHMRNVVFFNIEGGLLSIAHRGDILEVPIKSVEALEQEFWLLRNKAEKYKGVQTVVIDSGTELQTLNLEAIVGEAIEANRTSRSGKVRTRDDIWQEDYGKSTANLRRIFRWFKDLPMHTIFTALAKWVYPKTSRDVDLSQVDPIAVLPAFTAKLGASVMGYVDFVWYCYYDQETGKHGMLTKPQNNFAAKTRGPRFQEAIGPNVVGPNLAQLYDTWVSSSSPVVGRAPVKRKK